MSKVAAYLQQHIQGQVSTQPLALDAMSRDASVLSIVPEMVVYPRVTNDIRKVARFAWQLAEKGHVFSITARGGGSDQTGAAIGKGAIIALSAHMSHILEFDAKQKLIRLQPGVTVATLSESLKLYGMSIPALPIAVPYSTVGGAVSNNASSPLSGKYGAMNDWVYQLEVVLASGDVLQTERLSKRDLNRKKGLQTFEGEIYRSLDNLIEDNKELIKSQLPGVDDIRNNVGYTALSQVKRRDGSFDLTPLFVGAQGTLGVVSEMILKTEFVSASNAVAVIGFDSSEAARDAIDNILEMKPSVANYYSGELMQLAAEAGRTYEIAKTLGKTPGAVILVAFDEFGDAARQRKLKKLRKQFEGMEGVAVLATDGPEAEELMAIGDVSTFNTLSDAKGVTAPALFDGAYIPPERFEEFFKAVTLLAEKHRVALPLHGWLLESIYTTRPQLQLKKVGDKQKIFKLLDEYANLVEHHGGHLIAESGEGRLKTRFAYKDFDPELVKLFDQVRAIFDPHGILNPQVKQTIDVRSLVPRLGSGDQLQTPGEYLPIR